MFSVLLVEDDPAISDMLQAFLSTKSYQVLSAKTGAQALQHLHTNTPDIVLLDWMLPDIQGPALIREIRTSPVHQAIPVIMLTAKTEEADKVKGLNTGADDYMTKPVLLQELHARIQALLRRSQGLNQHQQLSHGAIRLDPENMHVFIHNIPVDIAKTEYRLLHFFMKNPNRLYSRTQLLDHVWGQTVYVEERTVDVHIMRLRKILKAHQLAHYIKTVRGGGYRFEVGE